MSLQFRYETPADIPAIETLMMAAFANLPHSRQTEPFIVRALRAAGELTRSIVAEQHGQLVGHLALSAITITPDCGQAIYGWYGLGPICVLPSQQGQGIARYSDAFNASA